MKPIQFPENSLRTLGAECSVPKWCRRTELACECASGTHIHVENSGASHRHVTFQWHQVIRGRRKIIKNGELSRAKIFDTSVGKLDHPFYFRSVYPCRKHV